jgi:hypothetical protein
MPTDCCPKCKTLWSEHQPITELCDKLQEARRCFRFLQREFRQKAGPGLNNKELAEYCGHVLESTK